MPPIDTLLETRTLIRVINDPKLDVPRQFLLSNYWGPATPLYSKYAEIREEKGRRGMSRFRAKGQAANVVGRGAGKVKIIETPYIREKKPVEASIINNEPSIGNVYIDGGEGIAEAQRKVVADDLIDLRYRVERREEWMAWEILKTGKIQYADDSVAFEVDFNQPTANMPTLTLGDRWNQSTNKILANLKAWSKLIRDNTGARGREVILGSAVAEVFLQDEKILKLLNNNNTRVGSLSIDEQSDTLGTFGGFTFREWSGQYEDENGVEQEYFPANAVLMLPADFKQRTRRFYGVIEEFVDEAGGLQQLVAQFFSKSWVEPDPAVRWILGASRPLPIVEQAGSWVYAIVQDPPA